MLLAIDVGNTNTVFAFYEDGEQKAEWRIATDARRTADEYFVWLDQLMRHEGIKTQITDVIICSVVPQVVFNLRILADRYFNTNDSLHGTFERGSLAPYSACVPWQSLQVAACSPSSHMRKCTLSW